MDYTIYLVEDDKNLNSILTYYLKEEGWTVKSFLNGKDAKDIINEPPDLWILDIMLPDIDGYQLIKSIKDKYPDLPVIFVSARDAHMDRVIGLEFGSDDYLAKPFLPRELVIRTKNILERTYKSSKSSEKLYIEPYTIDKKSRSVFLNQEEIDLTTKEYSLLNLFLENNNIALSREKILNEVWGDDYFGSDRVVDDLIRRLRNKMEKLNIETIYGFGYRVSL